MIANMLKRHQSKILTLVAIAVVVYLLTTLNNTSDYSINEREYVGFGSGSVIGPAAAPVNGGMQKGTGLASSLLPREVASEEDFGQFAPEDVLKGTELPRAPRPGRFPRNHRWCPPQCQSANPRGSP